jgi:hypothetical protein
MGKNILPCYEPKILGNVKNPHYFRYNPSEMVPYIKYKPSIAMVCK